MMGPRARAPPRPSSLLRPPSNHCTGGGGRLWAPFGDEMGWDAPPPAPVAPAHLLPHSGHVVNRPVRRLHAGLDQRRFPEPEALRCCRRRRRRSRLLLFHGCRSTHKLGNLYSQERGGRAGGATTALQNAAASDKSGLCIRIEGPPSSPSIQSVQSVALGIWSIKPIIWVL